MYVCMCLCGCTVYVYVRFGEVRRAAADFDANDIANASMHITNIHFGVSVPSSWPHCRWTEMSTRKRPFRQLVIAIRVLVFDRSTVLRWRSTSQRFFEVISSPVWQWLLHTHAVCVHWWIVKGALCHKNRMRNVPFSNFGHSHDQLNAHQHAIIVHVRRAPTYFC